MVNRKHVELHTQEQVPPSLSLSLSLSLSASLSVCLSLSLSPLSLSHTHTHRPDPSLGNRYHHAGACGTRHTPLSQAPRPHCLVRHGCCGGSHHRNQHGSPRGCVDSEMVTLRAVSYLHPRLPTHPQQTRNKKH